MYASVTSVRTAEADLDLTATLAAESLVDWLRQFEGYRGMLVFSSEDDGCAQFITFWDSAEALRRTEQSRSELRMQLIETGGAELEGVQAYAVVHVDGLDLRPAESA